MAAGVALQLHASFLMLAIASADLAHPSRLLDVLGALTAHPVTVTQIIGQVLRLSGSGYASDRLERHSVAELALLADTAGFDLRRLRGRSFNRARATVPLKLRPPR